MAIAFGEPIPIGDEHAICVSLPEWNHSIGFSCQDSEVLEALKSGYPRFSLHKAVSRLEERLLSWATSLPCHTLALVPEEAIKLFPSDRMAKACQKYLQASEVENRGKMRVRVAHITLDGELEDISGVQAATWHDPPEEHVFSVTYPSRLSRRAWKFWLHTGYGISSRFSAFWLKKASFLWHNHDVRINRSGKILPVEEAIEAAEAMREHIATLYSTQEVKATRGDVFLFQGGMAAITQTATCLSILCASRFERKTGYRVAIFGFLYTDTLKVLSNILGFNSTHYGYGSSKDMDALEYELKEGRAIDALYTEFPTNPLLTIVDLERLHALSVQYDFVLVVDDTIGTPINLLIAPWCDVVCTSLTKMYSGAGNVMGGSAVVSPWSRHHGVLRAALTAYHEDTYFPHDLLVMHANSSKFEERVATASRNAQSVAELLRRHRLVTEVLYPWGGPTQSLYDKFKRPGAGYGFLVSVRFSQPAVAIAFHDALETAKGPSFGTNFTLACPYTVLAHYGELDWAAQFGVWEHLVRISVGAEDLEVLFGIFSNALAAAENYFV
ncbi:PLP-dependent transferase [Glarea lozoyensis ATCC 20868]|uniref:PLP-dependent transferase n=1 Tax=Glarea lozoyensis (strain ATCC 20868 / MF5171) TaxID=1116229 RepID=S3CQ75_GLAL2|nr:PLP-dependent transferase [Glarea lozoyensis ATCC 20868]EPE27840.1 PLP-dependent transferase [Glarea lozoyensis ATCC 20868]